MRNIPIIIIWLLLIFSCTDSFKDAQKKGYRSNKTILLLLPKTVGNNHPSVTFLTKKLSNPTFFSVELDTIKLVRYGTYEVDKLKNEKLFEQGDNNRISDFYTVYFFNQDFSFSWDISKQIKQNIDSIYSIGQINKIYTSFAESAYPQILDYRFPQPKDEIWILDVSTPSDWKIDPYLLIGKNRFSLLAPRQQALNSLFERDSLIMGDGFNFFRVKLREEPSINSNIELTKSYWPLKRLYIAPVEIKLNAPLETEVGNIELLIRGIASEDSSQTTVLFNKTIGEKVDDSNAWEIKYNADNTESITFDKDTKICRIPALKVGLTTRNFTDFKSLQMEYRLMNTYQIDYLGNKNDFRSTDKVVSTIPIAEIGSQDYPQWLYLILLTIGLLLIIYFIWLVAKSILTVYKTENMTIEIERFTDSYEVVDYSRPEIGRKKADYYVWEQGQKKYSVPAQIYLVHEGWWPFGNPKIEVVLEIKSLGKEFSLTLQPSLESSSEFSIGNEMPLALTRNNSTSFFINIYKNDDLVSIEEPVFFDFVVRTIGSKDKFCQELPVQFFIGPELGSMWVGFDPGTTGTCITVGGHRSSINICPLNDKSIIDSVIAINKKQGIKDTSLDIDSVIAINKKQGIKDTSLDLDSDIYPFKFTVGDSQFNTNSQYYTFQSIKKLLGYTTEKEITIDNTDKDSTHTYYLNGKTLTTLLIKSLFIELKKNQPTDRWKMLHEAKRAVVAIPNNFTAQKIQDLMDCFKPLKQFKEVRYVYESEAVAFYYMSQNQVVDETLLVFDMGGATINATVLRTTYDSNIGKYKVDTLAKLGYGIGGDTIDYCIIKLLLEQVPDLSQWNFFDKKGIEKKNLKNRWWNLAKAIKEEIVRNFLNQKEGGSLITANVLSSYIKNSLSTEIATSSLEEFVKQNMTGEALKKGQLKVLVYENVTSICKDIQALIGNQKVTKIIFSGRSTAFPYIQETAKNVFNEAKAITYGLSESKEVVAKGACWYGVAKGIILKSNPMTSSIFGVAYTSKTRLNHTDFVEVIGMGKRFKEGVVEAQKNLSSIDFGPDNMLVRYFQVMGKDAVTILNNANSKHKYSEIAKIKLGMRAKETTVKVYENDDLLCEVELNNGTKLREKGSVKDQEITDANAEHYTWVVD